MLNEKFRIQMNKGRSYINLQRIMLSKYILNIWQINIMILKTVRLGGKNQWIYLERKKARANTA